MKNTTKKLSIVASTAILLVIAFVATQSSSQNKGAYRVGAILPLSGVAASFGEEVKAGIEASGIPDDKLIIEDDGCDSKKAVSAFLKLAADPEVAYIIGPVCGSPQEAIAPIVKDKDILVFMPAAASTDLFNISGGKMLNVQYSLEKDGAAIAEKIYSDGYRNVATIEYKNSFSEVSANSFKDAYLKNSGTKVVHETTLIDTNSDIKTELLKIKASKPDAIVVADVSFFLAGGIKSMKEFGINVPVYAQYPVELPAIRNLVEGVIYSYPELVGDKGALLEMGKIAGEIVNKMVAACGGAVECAQAEIKNTGSFDPYGVSNRAVIFKKIDNGVAKRV